MADRFHAIFGICRRRGGTKKKCYEKASASVSGPKRKGRSHGRPRRGRRECRRFGYSRKAGHKVCREYKAC